MQRIENDYGTFLLKRCFDSSANETFYDVFEQGTYNEETCGDYIGEFHCDAEYDEDDDNEYFLEQFDNWCKENS